MSYVLLEQPRKKNTLYWNVFSIFPIFQLRRPLDFMALPDDQVMIWCCCFGNGEQSASGETQLLPYRLKNDRQFRFVLVE